MMTIKGDGPHRLAMVIGGLVMTGVTFEASINDLDEWVITLTGGY